jgi:hypothetical protein
MNFEAVFNVFVGILALLGCTLIIIFSIVFREEKTIHPIYRSLATFSDADSDRPTSQSPAVLDSKQA